MGTLRAGALRWRGADLQLAVRLTWLQGAYLGIGEGAGGYSRASLPREHGSQAMGPVIGSEIHRGSCLTLPPAPAPFFFFFTSLSIYPQFSGPPHPHSPQFQALTQWPSDPKASQAPASITPTIQSGQHRPPHGQDQAQGRAKEEEVGHLKIQAAQADLGDLGAPSRWGLGFILQHTGVDAGPGRKIGECMLGED